MRAWPALPVLLLLVQPAAAAEAPPWERAFLAADPAEVLDAAKALPPIEGGSEFEILFEEGVVRFDERGHSEYVYRLAYRVHTADAAESAASVGATWQPWHQSKPELRARVITPDGVAHHLDPATVAETGAGPEEGNLYDDRRKMRGPLPGIAAGAVVEEETIYRHRAPILVEGDGGGRFWFQGMPTRKIRLRLEAPRSLPLRFAVHGIELRPVETWDGDRRIVTFEAGPLLRQEAAPEDVPPGTDRAPHVAFATARNWAELATAYHAVVEKQLAGSAADVAELVAGLNRKDGVDALVAALLERIEARVRYAGLEFGEAAVVPRRPAETLARRYGDCKDLSTLLVAALRSLGIEAHLALVATGAVAPDPALPGLGVFNHAIVAIPGKPPKFVDPTDPLSRGAFLPDVLYGRPALVAAPGTKALAPLPMRRAADFPYRLTYTIRIPERGLADSSCDIELPGALGAGMRAYLPPLADEQRREATSPIARSALRAEGGTSAVSFEAGGPAEPFRLHVEARRSRLGSADDDEAIAALHWADLLDQLPNAVGSKEERKHPLALLPFRAEVEVRVIAPPGYVLRDPPPSGDEPFGPFVITRGFETTKDGVLVVRARLDTGDRPVLTAAEAEAARRAFAAFQRDTYLHFDRTTAVLLAAGKTREAIAEERRLVALHPGEALHHAALAKLLLEVGLGHEARAEAAKAIALEPRSAEAYRQQAWILQHDRVGRRFQPGWDREGAIASYRKALELDPDDWYARADLAILLEHGTNGIRYAAGADLDGAIAEYRRLRERLKETPLAPNLLFALLRAGRFEELSVEASTAEDSPRRNHLWVAAVAATEGLDAAVRKANALTQAGEARRTVLAAASQQLVRVRRYDLAAGLLERAAVGSEKAHELQMQAALLARVKRAEELPASPDDPSRLYDRLLRAYLGGPAAAAGLGDLIAEALLAEDPDFDAGEAVASLGVRTAGETPLPVVVDFGASLVERTVQGDDETGYRVQLRAPSPTGHNEMVFYVVKERGAYRFRALSTDPPTLALEALDRVDRGDLAGARRWLAWAVDGPRAATGELDPLAAGRRVLARGDEATAGELRRAAAAIAARGPLEKVFERALELREAASDPEEALALDQGLAAAAAKNHRARAIPPLVERLAPAFPNSKLLFLARMVPYDASGRRKEGVAALRPIAEKAGDPYLRYTVMSLASSHGDFATAEEIGLGLIRDGKDTASVLNQLAWNALFRSDRDEARLEAAIEHARQATIRGGNRNYSHLHTLATLLAEVGRVREAIDTLRTALDQKDAALDHHDRYVVARVAEQLGLREEAAAEYRAIANDKSPNDTATLAHRRLTALEGAVGTR